ncbi:MAG: tetratricopeptide repeat protein [Elusimicrobiaceae bacterium]|nr:tetratricopeptide repeat protein [Elusimicrobiaceae bacterium]
MEKNKQNINNHGIIDKAVLAVKNHKKPVIIGVACIIAVAAIIGGVQSYQQKKYQKLWSDFFLAQLAIDQNKDNIDLSALETFVSNNKNTTAGAEGAMLLAEFAWQNKDYKKAEDLYTQAAQVKEFEPLANAALIVAKLAQNKYDEVISMADDFARDYGTHFAFTQVLQNKALALELSGKTAEAKEVYTQIVQQEPSGYNALFAENKLKTLK